MKKELETVSGGNHLGPVDHSRRQFLKGLGAVGAVAAAGGGLIPLAGLGKISASGQAPEEDETGPHQWVFVVDLRRCDGCDKCAKACRKMHNLREGEEWIRIERMTGASGQLYYRPVLCQICQNPPCVKVCPVGATYRVTDGVTVVDQSRCIGCRMCMAACPYGARRFNWDEPLPALDGAGEPTPEWPIPQTKGTASKCLACIHSTREGALPACVDRCNMGALYIGDLVTDLATDGDEIVRLSDLLRDNDAYRYKEELNTQTRVYYIAGHGQDSD